MFIFRWFGKFFRFIGTCLGYFNKTLLYVLELAVIISLIIGAISLIKTPSVQPNSVLVLDLEGSVRELPATEPILPIEIAQTPSDISLHQLLLTLDKAAKDPLISGILLKLDKLDKVGLASLDEIGKALDRYKMSGKPIWAWGTNFSQIQYALASHANEIYMHPMGEVLVKGLASNRLYYGELLKTLGINIHVFKAGAYKSFPESFISNKPSKEWQESELFWLSDAWKTLAQNVENSRGLMPNSINQYIARLPENVKAAKGDLATAALNANLIDGVQTYDQMVKTVENKINKGEKKKIQFFAYSDYGVSLNNRDGQIAVIIAEGEIHEGESQAGILGADSLVKQIEQAKDDKNIKAVVVRVNSPGGSAVASELIRHALEQTREMKPVVISMGDLAASGGYWISMGGSQVLSSPSSITGSIGVFGLAPTFERSLQLAKIGQGSVSTTWLANAERLTQPMDPRLENILTQSVARTYSNFISVVSQARKLSPQYIQTVAQGRVWTGNQAYERKLVDRIGDFESALNLAKELAKLDKNATCVYFLEPVTDIGSMLKQSIGQWINPLGQIGIPESAQLEIKQSQNLIQRSLEGKNRQIYAHSLLQPVN